MQHFSLIILSDARPPEPAPFDGIMGCVIGMPKFAAVRRKTEHGITLYRVKHTAPSKNEKEKLWPGTIFNDEFFGTVLPDGKPHPDAAKTYRVHQTITDPSCTEPSKWQLMYYDISLSHKLYNDGAPCDCENGPSGSHGGEGCLMESSSIGQVVEWLEKYAGTIPAGLDDVE